MTQLGYVNELQINFWRRIKLDKKGVPVGKQQILLCREFKTCGVSQQWKRKIFTEIEFFLAENEIAHVS